ncbi:MAG TPA: DNA-processing protein DprA [Vineibacter sp.]|nr:DNA-processing protein DprA [Vineibacter sp.]
MNALTPLPLMARMASLALSPAAAPANADQEALEGERLARARLARTARVGPVTFHEMLGHFGSAEAALQALPSLARRAGFSAAPVPPSADVLRREAAALARLGGRFLVRGDAAYPALLAQIPDAPPLLAAIGDLGLLAQPALAVVGARNASTNGRRLGASLAGELGAAGVVVVSGLARGIDTAAHRAALATGTIAVLAGGVDVIYPPENDELYRAIAAGGLILSEAPLGAVPQARHFPRRNRIVSGLSLGVLVVEAALQSGSLITARQAADQGREVFAVPGSPLDPRCRGTNRLIRAGAVLVDSASDILALLPVMGTRKAAAGGVSAAAGAEPVANVSAVDRLHWQESDCGESATRAQAVTPVESAPPDGLPGAVPPGRRPVGRPGSSSAKAKTVPDLTDQLIEKSSEDLRHQLLARLGRSPTPVDELIRECHVSAALVTAALLDLELSGQVERLQGNQVVLI